MSEIGNLRLVLHDRICLAKYGVHDEAFEAYLDRLARK